MSPKSVDVSQKRQSTASKSQHRSRKNDTSHVGARGARWVDVRPRKPRVSFGVRAPLAMILGVLERGDAQLSPGSNQVENF